MRTVVIAFTNIEYTIELAEALSELIDVILMIPEHQANRFKHVIKHDIKLDTFIQPRLRSLSNLLYIFSITKKINRLNADVIHIQRGHPWFNLVLKFLKCKVIVTTVHDVELHSGDKESSRIPQFTNKKPIKYANQVIVHGKELKREMIRKSYKNGDCINVINRGINSIYRRYIKTQIKEEENTILYFGRIWRYKGIKYLIEAEPLISEIIPNIKIIIAGRGEDFRERYQKLVVNKEKYTIYNEHISNEKVAELFLRCSIVVLPYIDASQSGVIPLAYAFKRPVVVTNVGSLPEVVDDGETGYIVPPRDPKKLAEAIINLLKDNKKIKRMGQNAYKKGKEELSWDSIALKTVEVYNKAIKRRS